MTDASEGQDHQPHVGRVVLASFVGTMIEWYDYFIFGTAAATVFGKLFFPSEDEFISRMAAYGTFAVGFFMRPLGGVIFGHFGDRMGRKAMLVTTLVIMGLATFLIGVLPTYESAGPIAPVLLIVLRLAQGLGVGGEWGGAVLMAVEHGGNRRRGLYGSCVQMGVPAGLLLAAGVFAAVSMLDDEQFLSWGWRIPFLLGVLLLAVGMFIRTQVFESPLFAESRDKEGVSRLPIIDVITRYPRSVLLAMGARFAENCCFYIFSVWIISYGTEQLGLQKQTLLIGVWAAAAVQMLAIPLSGILSDRIGRRPVYLLGTLFTAAFAFPFFQMVENRDPNYVCLAIVLGLVGHALMYGPQAAFFSELFGTRVRYSGASLGYQLASPFAGALAPIIADALVRYFEGLSWAVAVYLILTCVITFVSVLLAAETAHENIQS